MKLEGKTMSESEARALIKDLSAEEKVILYEMLSYLRQNRERAESQSE